MKTTSVISQFGASLSTLEFAHEQFTLTIENSVHALELAMNALNVRRIELNPKPTFVDPTGDSLNPYQLNSYAAVALDDTNELVVIDKNNEESGWHFVDSDCMDSILKLIGEIPTALTDSKLIRSLPLYPNGTHLFATVPLKCIDENENEFEVPANTAGTVMGARHDTSGPIYSIIFDDPKRGWVFFNPLTDGNDIRFMPYQVDKQPVSQ